MKSLLPRSLRGQMITLLLIGLAIAQVSSFLIYCDERLDTFRSMRDQHVLDRIGAVVRLLAETPPTLHEHIVKAASSAPLTLTISDQPLLETLPSSPRGLRLQQQLAALTPPHRDSIRVEFRPLPAPQDGEPFGDDDDERAILAVAVPLGSSQWLNLLGWSSVPEPFWEWETVLSASFSAMILSLLMVWMVRRITLPLARLSAAADQFGRGELTEPLSEQGPLDIQLTIRSFNQMRSRMERFVQDRTHMLAALSHDLRTPITALRVRAELIEEAETQRRILDTLEEMQRMTETTLAFVREESAQEDTRLIDLDALIESLCADLSDMGKRVSYRGPGRIPLRCRSVSMRRALANLIENAITYGSQARVALTVQAERLRIDIDDDGPGIAESDIEHVFEPFVRLEASRSLDTGGFGLGMTIARSIVRQHGGDIMLENRQEGGLRVTVSLPR